MFSPSTAARTLVGINTVLGGKAVPMSSAGDPRHRDRAHRCRRDISISRADFGSRQTGDGFDHADTMRCQFSFVSCFETWSQDAETGPYSAAGRLCHEPDRELQIQLSYAVGRRIERSARSIGLPIPRGVCFPGRKENAIIPFECLRGNLALGRPALALQIQLYARVSGRAGPL